jgi:hypothetical protein
MPTFTIETTFHLPVYRHRSITADTLEDACRLAVIDEDWWDQKHDYDNAGVTYVSAASLGEDAAYRGPVVSVPSLFADCVERRAQHFYVLLEILKRCAPAKHAAARAAIAKAEAILAGADDPA